MRLSGMAFWRATAERCGPLARAFGLAFALLALMPLAPLDATNALAEALGLEGTTPDKQGADTRAAQTLQLAEASRPELGQAASKPALPFSSEADLLAALGTDFQPIRELFLNIALAQLCGLKTKQVESEYLARRAQLVQRQDLDFDTLKALRYLSYISLERTLRAVQPAQLRPWCDAQRTTLTTFFQPQF